MGEFVRLEIDESNKVGTIRLDRPPMNALSSQLFQEIGEAADAATADARVGAVVVWGGPKIFAAGADVGQLSTASYQDMAGFAELLHAPLKKLAAIPKVVIAAINGFALGGGCEVALCADFRVAADNAQIGQPEILLGVIPGAGGTQRLPRIVGVSKAKEMIYSGRFYKAWECQEFGLVDAVYPAEEVYSKAVEMAAGYAKGPLQALRAAKTAIDFGMQVDLATGLAIEQQVFAALFATDDQKIGMKTFFEKGPGQAAFTGR
ncbi:MAG: enoyl-CoA hydratase-related protein [Actinomycetota bacterium]